MKPSFTDLPIEEQHSYGDGCTWVPDLAFEKTCRRHDWFYSIGCGANRWYENLWKAPYHKISEDIRLGYFSIKDALRLKHFVYTPLFGVIAVIYSLGLIFLPISWFFFTYGRWRSLEQVIQTDQDYKCRSVKRTCRNILRRLCCKL